MAKNADIALEDMLRPETSNEPKPDSRASRDLDDLDAMNDDERLWYNHLFRAKAAIVLTVWTQLDFSGQEPDEVREDREFLFGLATGSDGEFPQGTVAKLVKYYSKAWHELQVRLQEDARLRQAFEQSQASE